MRKLTQFNFGNLPLRTNNDSVNPLFVGKDVCEALGFIRPRDAIKQHVDPEDKVSLKVDTGYGVKPVTFVNESGLYALIFGSTLPAAKQFKRWVTSEVLPSIRKTGTYTLPVETIDSAQKLAIQTEVAKKSKGDRWSYARLYKALHRKFNVGSYQDLPRARFPEVMAFLSTLEATDKPGIYLKHEACVELAQLLDYIDGGLWDVLSPLQSFLGDINASLPLELENQLDPHRLNRLISVFAGTQYEIQHPEAELPLLE